MVNPLLLEHCKHISSYLGVGSGASAVKWTNRRALQTQEASHFIRNGKLSSGFRIIECECLAPSLITALELDWTADRGRCENDAV